MGTFSVPVQVTGPTGISAEVTALIDTGATHTLLPRGIIADLGITAIGRGPFQLADERTVEYEVGEVRLRLEGGEQTVLVVFGPEDATPLLGATTLELFNLAVNPVSQSLISVPGLLK